MLLRLLLLLTVVPLTELFLLLWISARTSVWFTIGLVLLTGVVGGLLARMEGWRTVRRIDTELRAGRMPGDALVDALLILVAGILLITPGVLTDAFGFALLIPPFRRVIKSRLKRRYAARFQMRSEWRSFDRSQIIDAEVVSDKEDED